MQALLKPRQGRPGDQDETVDLIARTTGGKVTVRMRTSRTFAVDGWRLYSLADRLRRITATELADLPWNGSGPDPLQAPTKARREGFETAVSRPPQEEDGTATARRA